jgi:hypothetical protein
MCNSVLRGKDWVEDFFVAKQKEINSVLDIGCGRGIWSGCLKSVKPSVVWHGIEIWQPYIDKYKKNLNSLYDNIYNVNAVEFIYRQNYDLVIMGDIIEHMSYKDAGHVLSNAIAHSKYFIISIPLGKNPHPPEHGNPYQEHITTWDIKMVVDIMLGCGGGVLDMREFDCAWLNNPIRLGVFIGYGKNNMVCGI